MIAKPHDGSAFVQDFGQDLDFAPNPCRAYSIFIVAVDMVEKFTNLAFI